MYLMQDPVARENTQVSYSLGRTGRKVLGRTGLVRSLTHPFFVFSSMRTLSQGWGQRRGVGGHFFGNHSRETEFPLDLLFKDELCRWKQ